MQASLPLPRRRFLPWVRAAEQDDSVWTYAGCADDGQQTWRRQFPAERRSPEFTVHVHFNPGAGAPQAIYTTLLRSSRLPAIPRSVRRDVDDFTQRLAARG